MPFTLAHPAAAVPLAKILGRFGSVCALAIGSMMPDLPFFLGIAVARARTHDVLSLLSWSLPAGMLMYVWFHALLRQALVDLAPNAIQCRLVSPPGMVRGWHGWGAVGTSVVLGAATHVVWDGFTHPGTLFVESIPLLQTRLMTLGSYELYVYKLLQHASSMIGLMLLAIWCWRWYACTAPTADFLPALTAAARWRLCSLLVAIPLAAGAANAWQHGWNAARLATFIFTTLPVFFWLLTAFSVARLMLRRTR